MMYVVFTIILFLNYWIWKIFSTNFFLGAFLVFLSFIFYLFVFRRKGKLFKLLIVGFVLLFFFQWQFSRPEDLTYLSNDEQRLQQMRLKEYPPVYINLFDKTLWIPIAHWFEGRKESIAFFRILKNFSESIDPNIYFFVSHPRERVGVAEFEKFPYILSPFFLVGVLSLAEQKKIRKIILLSTICYLLLLSVIGDTSKMGPFSLFPFFVVSSTQGVQLFADKLGTRSEFARSLFFALFFLIVLAVFIQGVLYAKY